MESAKRVLSLWSSWSFLVCSGALSSLLHVAAICATAAALHPSAMNHA